MLKRKLKLARIGLAETQNAFEALTNSLSSENIQMWTKQEEEALDKRGSSLDIYNVLVEKGNQVSLLYCQACLTPPTGPSQAQIQLALMGKETKNHLQPGCTAWLSMGIKLEQAQ